MPSRPTFLLIALPLLLAGCTGVAPSNDKQGKALPRPVVSVTPMLKSANDMPLPLDAYLLNPSQASAVSNAQQKLTSQCMHRFGFTYMPPAPPDSRDSDAPTTRTDGRYGHQSAVLMARWGYHPEGGIPTASVKSGGGGWMPTPEMAAAERGVSDPKQRFGPGGQIINGQKVPDHGCVGETIKQLTGTLDGRLGDVQIAEKIKFETLRNSQDDARTRAVFAKWALCMRDNGYGYADPLAAMGDKEWRSTPVPTQRELRVASTDAACRTKHNVVGVWYAVDFAYQKQAIKDNAKEMAAAKADMEALVRAAERTLAG